MIKVEWNDAGLQRSLKRFAKEMDETAEDMVKDLADKVGKRLAFNTEPHGVKGEVKRSSERAVKVDVERSYNTVGVVANKLKKRSKKAAAVYLTLLKNGEVEKANEYADEKLSQVSRTGFDGGSFHKSQRNRKGRVSKKSHRSSAVSTRNRSRRFRRRQIDKVGLAKASWYQAVQGLNRNKGAKRQPVWLRHDDMILGYHRVNSRGWGTEVIIGSKVNYMSNVLSTAKKNKALRDGMKGYKRYLDKVILK